MRLVVFGAGAVGSRFAVGLARAGSEVTIVARPEHAAAVTANGLGVEADAQGPVRIRALERLPVPYSAELVVLTVKSYDVETAGRALAEALDQPTPVLALQNGLGIEEALSTGLSLGGWKTPLDWILRGVHTVPARLVGPGLVAETGEGAVVLGRNPKLPGWPDRLKERFESAGFPARVVDDIRRETWRKAIVNAAINPVTADHGIPNGRLVEEPWRGQALALLREAVLAARAEGIDFDLDETERAVFTVARATAANRSSMLEDLDHHRRTELDAISGVLLATGRAHGVPMPATVRAIERIRTREHERGVRP
ncbi:MAG: 2-dehydropantoate 2-reductase [Thermoplasmata archaeon]|nr:2-dehydropantoate 2-reductase [Thermoplasmata archaeon]